MTDVGNLISVGIFILVVALSIADVVTTLQGVKAGLVEANPIMAWLQKTLGTSWIAVRVLGAVAIGAGLLYLPQPISLGGLFLLALTYAFVVWNNYQLLHP